ncbi:MAG: hypothetical protein GY801_02515 [bacterium]|nr:hypothetical protein [bacterium]
MDAKRALQEILDAAKPMTATAKSQANLVQDCAKSGITVDSSLNILSGVAEKNIDDLSSNLNNVVLKMVVRRMLRKYS